MISKPEKSDSTTSKSPASIYIDGKKYPLSEQVVKNIETIIGFQTKQERNIPIHEQILDKIASFFGKSIFLYLQLIFFITWGLCSHFTPHLLPWNFPKFNLEEMGVDIASLLIATGVLVQQTRQDKLAEQRSHLNLQINLLTEQKIAKLIELVEELRKDIPIVHNRYDWEAEMMKEATDPQIVLDILQENLEQSTEEQKLDQENSNQ
ncbi:hypothetical protein Sta7437_4300 [Stanieria cyanosphaera PCC 7437]|uniref:DUF1003 domain-containing protein n=1 Tax=Stanieria cyanosphaera (strain ATCC 29371 / PCC 7437) TaxID=111780 RepID=K9XYU2_STAC7|nr:DUF1003 domain-containing protein [Stanieria cyanosphaera]AFZ37770.1 hypothetical protein Sta7437_4300 [Stanieria cyanosphaera PCC 7437]